MKKQVIAAMLTVSLLAAGGTAVTQAFSLGSILKVGGVTVLVDKFGGQINDFLNKLLMKNGVGTDYATKVVPVLSIGTGKYIGAVQVVGPTAQVDKVKAVGQLEGSFNDIARAKALIPLESVDITHLSRVQGVGVSAIIDLKF
ncbi:MULTISPECIES: hypothetical protein [Megasphaera]|jgi:hypothetical protein|uniref:hypothetical protein n=1 Tax=Megasphaera TaxID=906 RepID=UPI000B3BD05D|nr:MULTISPECIES: hypothetical protein [Megasphaera]MBM6732090.1 hypothetical protein [Megasphaera stantonii]MDN0046430.1 hypothetical protein [Megasphaera hexanoica]OUO45771.1 hypothetical protein B5F80_07555 [Megasphaera sp. An286]HJE81868.1 hypothetical protein [Megasphaera stantonii]